MSTIEDWVADYRSADTNEPQDGNSLDVTGNDSYSGVMQDMKAVIRQVGLSRGYEPDWRTVTRTGDNTIQFTVASSSDFAEEFPVGTYILWDTDTSLNANTGHAQIAVVTQDDPTTVTLTLTQMRDIAGTEVTSLPVDTGWRIKMGSIVNQKPCDSMFVDSEDSAPPPWSFDMMTMRTQTRGAEAKAYALLPLQINHLRYYVMARVVDTSGDSSIPAGAHLVRQVSKDGRGFVELEAVEAPDASGESENVWVEWEINIFLEGY